MIHTSDATGFSMVRSHAGFLPPTPARVKTINGLNLVARPKYRYQNNLHLPERGELIVGVQPGFGIRMDDDLSSTCVPPFFPTVTHTGTFGVDPIRYSVVPVSGKALSFFIDTGDELTIYAPDGTTVLADDFGELTYTFPDAQTYFIETSGGSGPFTLTISAGPSAPVTLPDGEWSILYVPQTKRVFVMSTFQANEASVLTCLDSTSLVIVGQTTIKPIGDPTFVSPTQPLFYRPVDDSVWCFTRDTSTGAVTSVTRFSATDGSLIEQTPISDSTIGIFSGIYSPADDLFYGIIDIIGHTTITSIKAFSPISRTVVHTYPLPFNDFGGPPFAYDSSTGKTYFLTAASGSVNDRRTLTTLSGGVASTNTISSPMESCGFMLAKDGFIYGSHFPRHLNKLDIAGLSVTSINQLDYNIQEIVWDDCQECLGITLTNGTDGHVARVQTDGMVIGFSTLATVGTVFHPRIVWNPDRSRLVSTTNDKLYEL